MRSLAMIATLILILAGAAMARAEIVCIEAPYDGDVIQGPAAIYAQVRPVLERYPDLADAMRRKAPALCVSDRMKTAHGYFEPGRTRIVISRDLPQALQVGILLHELRHLWQADQNTCPTDALGMKEFARATFAIEADASAVSLMIAWDMKARGAPEVWDALAAWPQQADIAARYAAAIEETGDAALATTAAFYQWYALKTRRDEYYYASCSDYLDRQDESHALPRYQMVDEGFYTALCRMPDGRVYDCADPRGQ